MLLFDNKSELDMRRVGIFFLLLITPLIAFPQASSDKLVYHSDVEKIYINNYLTEKKLNAFELQLIADPALTASTLNEHKVFFNEVVTYFKEKRNKSKDETRFLSTLFYKVHRKYLKNYKPFTSFHTTLSTGDYDCLSGTTFYALLLNQFDVDYSIIEMNYHIYIKVKTSSGNDILIESTDPLNGFITNQKEIDSRLAVFNNEAERPSEENEYKYDVQLHEEIDIRALSGLHYYNEAVENFNNQQLDRSVFLLEKARLFYFSPRLNEFGHVLAQALLSDDKLEVEKKRGYLSRIAINRNDLVSIN